MNRLLEMLLGLDRGFLSREGALSVGFDPKWPWGETVGHGTWNLLFVALAVVLVIYVYRRETGPRPARVALGALRLGLLLLLITLLNRPAITLTQNRVEPSVLAVLVDDSMSMRLTDIQGASPDAARSRLQAALDLLGADDAALVRSLAERHALRFYRFSDDVVPLDVTRETTGDPPPGQADAPAREADAPAREADAIRATLDSIRAEGGSSRIAAALRTVADSLQGQRVAGVVLLTDGRSTGETDTAHAELVAALREREMKVFAVPLGSEQGLRNVEVESVNAQESVFAGDIVNLSTSVRATGLAEGETVTLQLVDAAGIPVSDAEGPVQATITPPADGSAVRVELPFAPATVGTLDLAVLAVPVESGIDEADNSRALQLAVLDANISVLYVDGYPRWEYRYLKQDMIRDRTVAISCLLTSADEGFAQEGDRPITRFPESIDEMLEYDVVLIGDVDPRQFTDAQLALVNEFVARRGGGFGMVAGPRYAPHAYRNTAIEPLLPVEIARVEATPADASFVEPWRPVLTEEGRQGSLFRFFRDAAENESFLRNELQPLFWFARNVTAKPGVGQVLAQHPTETGPDGRPAPIVVVGRFGAGRTLFSGIDDSWRWRFYTGEQVFSSYWVQSLRYLARGKKLGQRRLTISAERPVYELGDTARVSLRLIDPALLSSVGAELVATVVDDQGIVTRTIPLAPRASEPDVFAGAFNTDRPGRYRVSVTAPDGTEVATPLEVVVPRAEFADPRVDRTSLTRLATDTGGRIIDLPQAAAALDAIPTARRVLPLQTDQPLWASPLALGAFVLLLTLEWVGRKWKGMV